MKFIKFIIIFVIILGIIGYGVYSVGTKVASDKMIETVSKELEKSGEFEEVKQAIENDPELKSFLNDGISTNDGTSKEEIKDVSSVDESKLPFTTKEEATKVLVKKIGVSEISEMKSKYQAGTLSKDEALQVLQDKLSEEEIMALKVIAYKEVNKQ